MMYGTEANAGELYDLLADTEDIEGLTKQELLAELAWGEARFQNALKRARAILAETGTANIISLHRPGRGWCYMVTADYATARPWIDWMWRRIVTQLNTTLGVLRPMERLTTNRSKVGRKIRALQLHLTRAIEDLERIDQD